MASDYNTVGSYLTGTQDKYKLDPFGGMAPGDKNRSYLLGDLKKMDQGRLGMSTSGKRQAVDASNQQAAANVQAQSRDTGQAALAAGPMSAVSGRAAQNQAGSANALAQAGALASAETERTSQALAEQQRQAIRGALSAEQDRNRQDTQFWVNTLLGGVGIAGKLTQAGAAAGEAGADTQAAAMGAGGAAAGAI